MYLPGVHWGDLYQVHHHTFTATVQQMHLPGVQWGDLYQVHHQTLADTDGTKNISLCFWIATKSNFNI